MEGNFPLSESVRAVERALDILLCFSRQTPELNMTQIADHVGIHKSTVHRLLATLETKRFVQRDPETGVYRLGIRLLQMAYLTLEQNDLRRIATPFLHHLGEQHPSPRGAHWNRSRPTSICCGTHAMCTC